MKGKFLINKQGKKNKDEEKIKEGRGRKSDGDVE